MKVRIGIGSLPVSADAGPRFDALVDALEERGIDSLWLADLVSSGSVDPLAGLAYAAGRTRRLKIGTGVLVLPGRNPMLVAAQLASLAALAPRRVLPVFGVRPARAADRQLYPLPAGERAAVFDEALVVVRRLLTEERVTHHGRFFRLDDAGIGMRPPGRVDLWLGGRAPAGLSRIGRLADGWLGSYVTPGEARECREHVVRAAAEAGREIEADHYGTNLAVVPPEAAPEQVDAVLADTARRRPGVDPHELVAVSWARARELLERFVEAGLTKFVVRPAVSLPSWGAFLDQFCSQVRPLET